MTKGSTVARRVVHLDCEKFAAESLDYFLAYQRAQEGARCDTAVESKAFAFFWTAREAGALGKNPVLAVSDDPLLAAELSLRQLQWQAARLEWHLFWMRKQNPVAFDATQTQRARDAAYLGSLLGDPHELTNERLIEFIKRRSELSEHEWRVFDEAFRKARTVKPADWRHPELDTWLMCMRPIVARFNWTYQDVLDAAQKKFPGQHGYLTRPVFMRST
jgi:hypothetical protein